MMIILKIFKKGFMSLEVIFIKMSSSVDVVLAIEKLKEEEVAV